MINNYQRDAGQEDDRDSGSLSLISPLDEGDQVFQKLKFSDLCNLVLVLVSMH